MKLLTKLGVPSAAALGVLCLLASCGDDPAPLDPDTQGEEVPDSTPKSAELIELDEAKLGDAFRQLGNGDFPGCRETATLVLNNNPAPQTRARAEFLIALGFHKAKQYADARPHFDRAQAEVDFAGKASLPYFQGWCYFWLGEMDLAEASFETHLARVEEGDSRFGLGIIALERGDMEKAAAELGIALRLFEAKVAGGDVIAKRDLAKTHARLADVNLDAEDFAGAQVHLQQATGLDSNRAAVWYKLYQVALELGDDTLAAASLAEYKRCQEAMEAGSGMGGGR